MRVHFAFGGLNANHGSLRDYHVKPGIDYVYVRPPKSHYVNFLFTDYGKFLHRTFRGSNLPALGALAIGTGFLIDIDQEISNKTMRLGDQWGIKHTDKQKPLVRWSVKLGGNTIKTPLNFPHDLNSSMYFLGDGIVHGTIASSFWSYGKLAGDERAVQTGAQMVETILCTGAAIQALKHVFGRETAVVASKPGGNWHFFPNPKTYSEEVPHYDAMPSGHVATFTATMTIIADNYPEVKWIRPVGYPLLGVLMFSMVNNGVHWASDYPVGIAIGYTFAKIVDGRAQTILGANNSPEHHAMLLPYVSEHGNGLQLHYRF